MRATNLNSLSAISILFLTMVCTAIPARAVVNITATRVGDTEFIISYANDDMVNIIRAFAFDIWLCSDVNIISVTALSADYCIYPGTIQIDASGNVTDYGTAVAEYDDLPSGTLYGLDSNGITIEMASLYAPVGPGSPNAPAQSGDLLSIRLDGPVYPTYASGADVSEYCCVTISGNVARAGPTGVVMEDPNEIVEVNYHSFCFPPPPCHPYHCMKFTAPEYPEMVAWGWPECWCYRRQCRGDATGTPLGPYWVQLADLNVLKSGWYKIDAVLATVPNGICADFNHAAMGPYRVTIADLNILKEYWYKAEALVPECDSTHYNCWIEP